jgi:hypothetical protein
MIAQRLLVGTAALVLLGTLTACSGDAEPVAEEPTPTPTPTEVATADPEPEAVVFTMPVDCTTILPQSRLDAFAAQSLELLGGPGSVYGDDYFFEPTPEQLAGGISCVYAQDGVDQSSVLISVAPVSTANRASIIDDLTAQGLNEATTPEGSLTYSQQGDESLRQHYDRVSQVFGVAAAKQALADSGLVIDADNAEDIGVIFGSGVGGPALMSEAISTLQTRGPKSVSPFFIANMLPDTASGQIASSCSTTRSEPA